MQYDATISNFCVFLDILNTINIVKYKTSAKLLNGLKIL